VRFETSFDLSERQKLNPLMGLKRHMLEYHGREKIERQNYPCNRPWKLIELSDVEDPTFCRQSAHS
jgi:hypothetical protein